MQATNQLHAYRVPIRRLNQASGQPSEALDHINIVAVHPADAMLRALRIPGVHNAYTPTEIDHQPAQAAANHKEAA